MKEKLIKIKTLAERGATEGEREATKYLFSKLCKKHGIKAEDLKKITDVMVSYSDGVKVQFFDDVNMI